MVIYPNDHLPSHVHVFKADGEVRINLGADETSAFLMSVVGDISDKDVARALNLIQDNQTVLLAKWKEIHG